MKLSKIFQVLWRYFSDRSYRILLNSAFGFYNKLPDEEYLKLRYNAILRKPLDLESPKTFNEKLQWLKLHDRNPQYTVCVDKYKVREYIAQTIGKEYLIPLLGVWDTPDKIDFNRLPDQFVLKCNHNSGLGMCICKDKSHLNIAKVKKDLWQGLKQDYYLTGREWPYKNVQPRIIAEKYMVDESGYELKDYKIFVFNGIPKFIQVDYDRFTNHHRNFYDTSWNYVPFTTCYPTNPSKQIIQPVCLDEMLNIAEKLTSNIGKPAFCRIDLYVTSNKIYFGEITFYHGSGFEKFEPEEWDQKLGELINLMGII